MSPGRLAAAPGRAVGPGDRGTRGAPARGAARAGALLALAMGLLACGAASEPVDRPSTRPVAARASPPAPPSPEEPLDACVEERLHGRGYDELAARDVRRKLRRLQVRAECEARRGR